MNYTESLVNQKDYLIQKMKELLLVNDMFQLKKCKEEYDIVIRKLSFTNGTKNRRSLPEKDLYSRYATTNVKPKVNPRFLKQHTTPVQDANFIVYRNEIIEETQYAKKQEPTKKENFYDIPESALETLDNEHDNYDDYNEYM
jgi:hypothetical protein